MKKSTNWFIRAPADFYVWFIRGTPSLIQILTIYFGLPQFGIRMSPITAGIIALGLSSGAYAGQQIIEALEARGIEPLIAISRQQAERPYHFRPPKKPDKPPPKIIAPWRVAMLKKLQTGEAKVKYQRRPTASQSIWHELLRQSISCLSD